MPITSKISDASQFACLVLGMLLIATGVVGTQYSAMGVLLVVAGGGLFLKGTTLYP